MQISQTLPSLHLKNFLEPPKNALLYRFSQMIEIHTECDFESLQYQSPMNLPPTLLILSRIFYPMLNVIKPATIKGQFSPRSISVKKQVYEKGFVHRVRIARESAGYSREEMAKILGVKVDTYARYEARTMMPHHLLPIFVEKTEISFSYLFGATPTRRRREHLIKSVT